MSKLFLDLSTMKKLKAGKDHTVFEHKDGHQIHVKNSALSPKMRGEMEKLTSGGKINKQSNPKLEESKKQPLKFAQGGSTDDVPEPNQKNAQGFVNGFNKSGWEPSTWINNIKQGISGSSDDSSSPSPSPTPMAEGGDPIKIDLAQATANQDVPAPAQDAAVPEDQPYQMGTVADPTSGLPDKDSSDTIPIAAQVSASPESAPLPDNGSAGPAIQPSAPKAPQANTIPQNPTDNITSGISRGIGEERQGIEQEAAAKGQMSQDTAQALQEGQAAKNQNDVTFRDQLQGLTTERQNIINDIQAKHIDPNQLISQMDVPQKIATGIGLILGGIGGGLTHQENPALKYLNNQIDRNINAQQAELGKKENLLSANYRQFGNLEQARDFTRVNHNDLIKNMVDQAAAKAGTPMAQAEALKLKGQLDQNSGMLMAKVGAMSTLNHPNAGVGDINSALQTLRVVDPEKAKEAESRLIPNVGMSSVPLDQATRAKIVERNTLDNNINQLIAFQKKYGGTLEGITDPQVRAQGEALSRQVQDQYRRGNDQGVFKPAEAAFVNGVIADNPSSLFSKFTKLPGYKSASAINQGNLKELYGSVGMRPFNINPVQQPQRRFIPGSFKPRR